MVLVWPGQSLGRRYLELRVVCRDGRRLRLRTALLRELLWYLTNLALGANAVVSLVTGRGLPDRILQTQVVTIRPRPDEDAATG